MDSLKVKLVSKKQISKDTISYNFTKPKNFKYIAGQYCDWFIPSVPKSKVETGIRSLSLSSAPYEKELTITIRQRNTKFKNFLASFSKGDQITMNGPQGDLILPKISSNKQLATSSPPLVLIAGGIGVTPFHSIVLEETHKKGKRKIFLFHFNKSALDAPFMEEFQKINNKDFEYIPVITRDKIWSGEKGHLNKKLILKYLKDLKSLRSSIYYLAGKPEMVREVKKLILSLGIDEGAMFQEEFDGY